LHRLLAVGFISLAGAMEVCAGSPIRLKNRNLDLASPAAAAAPARSLAEGRRHYLVVFRHPPGPEDVRELVKRGAVPAGSAPDSAVVVAAGDAVSFDGLDVAWVGALAASDKLSARLAETETGVYLVSFHQDVDMTRARLLVAATGLEVREHPHLLAWQVLAAGPLDRVEELADWDDVAYVMPASAELAAGEPVVACAGAATAAGLVGEYSLASSGWSHTSDGIDLGYVLESLTAKLPGSTVQSEILRAFQEWARYSKVSFHAGTNASAARTVVVKFARGAHGDGYPFDGPGKVLAHTFYPSPPNQEPLAGDMHLDDDESWNVGTTTDLFSVVLHEAGHALGLGHSDRPGSVMYPYYRQAAGLTSDDIEAIRALYGTRDATTTTATAPADPSTPSTPTAPAKPATPPSPADAVPPTLKITYPAFTIFNVSSASISIRGMAADNVGVTSVQWSNSTGTSGTASGTTDWSASVPLLRGNNVITVRAYDAAGNSSWRTVTVVRR
jgi:hypothetical protein